MQAVASGLAVGRLLRGRADAVWLVPLAAVLVRLALDPLDYTYYSVAPQLLVLVGCGLLPTAARPARVLPVLAIPICAGVVLPLLRRSEVAPPVRR